MATDIIASGLGAGGWLQSSQKTFVVAGARPGVDAYALIAAAVARAKAAGGGAIILPYIGGYTISQPIVVDFDNCTILLDDDCTFTMTNPTVLVGPNAPFQTGVNGAAIVGFYFGGKIAAGATGKFYIKRPQLIGLRRVTINTNAQNVTGFTYVVGAAGQHCTVLFFGCYDARCENVIVKNGLCGGIIASYTPDVVIENCIADTTLYDNGITVGFNKEQFVTVSDDPASWGNGKVINGTGINCGNHAVDIFGMVGATLVNPISINCGNNTNANPSGPAGGIGIEHDGTNLSRDYRATVVNPRVDGSFGFGLRTNCKGTRVIGGRISGTKNPSAYADSTPKVWGSNVFVQGAATLELIGTDIEDAAQVGIRLQSAPSLFPSLYVNGGKISGNGFSPAGTGPYALAAAIYAIDFNEIVLSPDVLFSNNGNTLDTTAGNQYTITLNNGVSNIDNGLACIAGRFESNRGGIWQAARVGTIDTTKGISGIANGSAWAVGYHMMLVNDKVTNLQMGNINLSQNGNSKTARLAYIGSVVNALVNHNSILGDQVSTGLPKVQILALTGTNNSTAPIGTIFGTYAATYTPNSYNGSITIGSPFLTGNMTIANDVPTVLPIDGQRITFTFIQDATGGRSITWGALWRGATLTGAGTANQRASVTFEYRGSNWGQVSSTGWFT